MKYTGLGAEFCTKTTNFAKIMKKDLVIKFFFVSL